MSDRPQHLARIAYNSNDWHRPAGAGEVKEGGKSYRREEGFGHEDWLFRNDWLIDGWRYAFVQGVNSSRNPLLKRDSAFDLTLFTIDPQGQRRYVARICEVECLSDTQAEDAVKAFKKQGWFELMRQDVCAASGKVEALDSTEFAPYILNLRYRLENVTRAGPKALVDPDEQAARITRYQLCAIKAPAVATSSRRLPAGSTAMPLPTVFTRTVVAGQVQCSPEHMRMQAKLMTSLCKLYPHARVVCEENNVDVSVHTREETILFEIKSDLSPLTVVRQALGQILEYAYHPRRTYMLPLRLVIVGRKQLTGQDLHYFTLLKDKLSLPIEYQVITI